MVISTALRNYNTLWGNERSTYSHKDDIPYIDMNLKEFETLVQKIKSENK